MRPFLLHWQETNLWTDINYLSTGREMAMDDKNAKLLLTGIVNGDDALVSQVIGACFESAYRKAVGRETDVLMESIGSSSKARLG